MSATPAAAMNPRTPSVVFGPGLTGLAEKATNAFAGRWRATVAPSNELAGRANANVLVLGGQPSEGESAILTAAKVKLSHPETRVVILGPEALRGPTEQLGITLLPCTASLPQVLGLAA
jgi:hypothetical protein